MGSAHHKRHVPGSSGFRDDEAGGTGLRIRGRSPALPWDRRIRRMPLRGRGHVTQLTNMRVTAKQRGCDRGKRDK